MTNTPAFLFSLLLLLGSISQVSARSTEEAPSSPFVPSSMQSINVHHPKGNLKTTIEQTDFITMPSQTATERRAQLHFIKNQGRLVFSTPFNKYDGFGDGLVNLDNPVEPGGRPTLMGGGQGFLRINGLDSQSCLECHSILSSKKIPSTFAVGGAGGGAVSAFPAVTEFLPSTMQGDSDSKATFNGRVINPPFVFGSGGIELLAKEITAKLQAKKAEAAANIGQVIELDIQQGDVILNFGSIIAEPVSSIDKQLMDESALLASKTNCDSIENTDLRKSIKHFIGINRSAPEFIVKNGSKTLIGNLRSLAKYRVENQVAYRINTDNVEGIDGDLVVRPFGRKGNNVTTRDFDCGAIRFHMGVEPEEVVGTDNDHDNDGHANEVTIAEMSALAVFNTTSKRPRSTRLRGRGFELFKQVECDSCHVPLLKTESTVLQYHQPEKPLEPICTLSATEDCDHVYYQTDLSPLFHNNNQGGLNVQLFSDLKRHDMGIELQENLAGASDAENRSFITARLWGVADTAPYMHDGRATTIEDAIKMHGGESEDSKNAFMALSEQDQGKILTFLNKLRTPRNNKRIISD